MLLANTGVGSWLQRDNLMTSIVTCIMTATIVSVSVFVWERPHNPMFENSKQPPPPSTLLTTAAVWLTFAINRFPSDDLHVVEHHHTHHCRYEPTNWHSTHTQAHAVGSHVIPTKPRLTNLAGYGDIVPITPAGRLLGSVGALIGIGLFTLPAGKGYHLLHLHACMHVNATRPQPHPSPASQPPTRHHCIGL